MPELPPILDRFVAELTEEGFSIAVDLTDQAHFGNRLLELARGDDRIRLIRDRGQWDIDVAVGACWRTPYMVVLALRRCYEASGMMGGLSRMRSVGVEH